MSSQRYPGKVLYKINGKPLLHYLLTSLKKCKNADQIVIATSIDSKDDFIEAFCIENGVTCFRRDLEDVAKRMLKAAKTVKADAFVRINGDSPLLDPRVVEQAISIYQNGNYDLVTNTFPRSFPVGQSVEVIKTSTFELAYQKMTKSDEFEHITKYFYNHSDDYKIYNFKNNINLSHYRLVVDTLEDMDRFEQIINSMDKPHTDYCMNDIIALYPMSSAN